MRGWVRTRMSVPVNITTSLSVDSTELSAIYSLCPLGILMAEATLPAVSDAWHFIDTCAICNKRTRLWPRATYSLS